MNIHICFLYILISGRSSPILEPFFLRGGREVAGMSDFVAVFDDLGGWWTGVHFLLDVLLS